MERYQVIIAYDGTNFQGFQRQGRSRTVQGVVEEALALLGWHDRTVLYAGRTDSGVHASGQVLAFDLEWSHSCEALQRAINVHLPQDVSVTAVATADKDFHPRYQAVARQYHYSLFCQAWRDPLREYFSWRIWPDVQAELLIQCAACLPGAHDFAAFGSPLKPGGTTVRTVYRADWVQEEHGGWSFRIAANAFLYRMVRRLVFLQVLVGQQRLSLSQFAEALQNPQPLTPGLAKPNGLVLEKVFYPSKADEPEGLINTSSASGEEDCG